MKQQQPSDYSAAAQNKRPAEHEATVAHKKPETALPWVAELVGVSSPGPDGFDVHELFTADGYRRVAEAMTQGDAYYAARACNAYPKLIAALQTIVRVEDCEHSVTHITGVCRNAASLLRELGEL